MTEPKKEPGQVREVWVREENGEPVVCALYSVAYVAQAISNAEQRGREEERAVAEAQRWIPVTERYPDGGRVVLVFDAATTEQLLAWRDRDSPVWFPSRGLAQPLSVDVTHWQPLPKPPEVPNG